MSSGRVARIDSGELEALKQTGAPDHHGRSRRRLKFRCGNRLQRAAEAGVSEWTGDGRLRHPRFLGLRRDKAPRDGVRERPGGS